MISRRRIIKISAQASIAGLAQQFFLGKDAFSQVLEKKLYKSYEWRGIVLGAESTITLQHYDSDLARDLLLQSVAVINKYEAFFSLYHENSMINILNKNGSIKNPEVDFTNLLKKSTLLSHETKGAFDITVQPLWNLLKENYDKGLQTSKHEIKEISSLIDYRKIALKQRRVFFKKPKMQITLNGIAQGFITDKVAEFLSSHGIENILCDLGEIRAMGAQSNGKPWNIAVLNHSGEEEIAKLTAGAIATSSFFNSGIGAFHLINSSSKSKAAQILQPLHRSVTVFASTAVLADGYSTAFMNMEKDEILKIVKKQNSLKAHLTDNKGQKSVFL